MGRAAGCVLRGCLDSRGLSDGGFGGAITAALYLQEFVGNDTPWAHLDLMAWNLGAKPGRPAGGEVQTLRAVFELIERRFAAAKTGA